MSLGNIKKMKKLLISTLLLTTLINLFGQSSENKNLSFKLIEKTLLVTEFYQNGKIKIESTYTGKKLDEVNEENLLEKIELKKIKLNGSYKSFYQNGQLKKECSYKKNIENYGSSKHFTPKGEKIYIICDKMPSYPEGFNNLNMIIQKKIKEVDNPQLKGSVYVSFIITKTGILIEFDIARGSNVESNKAAIEIVKSLEKFIPAEQDGEPVNCMFNLPVRFG